MPSSVHGTNRVVESPSSPINQTNVNSKRGSTNVGISDNIYEMLDAEWIAAGRNSFLSESESSLNFSESFSTSTNFPRLSVTQRDSEMEFRTLLLNGTSNNSLDVKSSTVAEKRSRNERQPSMILLGKSVSEAIYAKRHYGNRYHVLEANSQNISFSLGDVEQHQRDNKSTFQRISNFRLCSPCGLPEKSKLSRSRTLWSRPPVVDTAKLVDLLAEPDKFQSDMCSASKSAKDIEKIGEPSVSTSATGSVVQSGNVIQTDVLQETNPDAVRTIAEITAKLHKFLPEKPWTAPVITHLRPTRQVDPKNNIRQTGRELSVVFDTDFDTVLENEILEEQDSFKWYTPFKKAQRSCKLPITEDPCIEICD